MKRFLEKENGQVLVLAALLMTVLLGFGAIAVDIGMVTATKSKLQNTADSSALAAASVYDSAESAAIKYAELNGLDFSVDGTTIDVEKSIKTGETNVTYEEVYSESELEQEKAKITENINDMTDIEIIGFADEYNIDITDYIDGSGTNRTFKSGTPSKTREQIIDDLKDELDLKSDIDLIALAKTLGIETSAYTKNNDPDKFQNDNSKEALIIAVINTNEYQQKIAERLAAQTDYKSSAIQYIINEYITDLANEKVSVGDKKGNSNKVSVTITKKVKYTFAKILGFNEGIVTAQAVAENATWAGDALPFINLDGLGEDSPKGQPLESWNMTGPGDKERISNNDLVISPNSIKVNYEDGFIEFKKGKDLSNVRDPLKEIIEVRKTVYLFSIKHSEMDNYAKDGDKELKNGDLIPLEDIVLLECVVLSKWDGTGSDVIKLKFVESYSWNEAKDVFMSATGKKPGGSVRLVK